jgi:hypothetical protein
MNAFGGLHLRPLPDGKSWEVERDWCILGHAVPAGTKTDFASIPRILWVFLPPWGKYGPAAILHDYLYSTGYSRIASDTLFYALMKVGGVSKSLRFIMYWAVRLFGQSHWKQPK